MHYCYDCGFSAVQGSLIRTCGRNGLWNGSIPHCECSKYNNYYIWVHNIILSMLEHACMLNLFYTLNTDSEHCYLLNTCRSFFNESCTNIDWYHWWHRCSDLHWNCHDICYHHHYSLQDESKTQQAASESATCAWQGYYRCWKQDLWRNWSNAPAKDGHRKQCCLCFVSQYHEISFMCLSATV